MTYKPKKRKNKMSKQAEERAKKAYPLDAPKTIKSVQEILQETYIEGYEQAEKDYIELAQLWVDSGNVNVMSFKSFLKMWHEKEGNQ